MPRMPLLKIVTMLGIFLFPALLAFAQEATEEPDPSTTMFEGTGFTLFVPPNATIETASNGVPLILGPEITIRPGEMDFTVSGPAYELAFATAENPEMLSGEEWATEQILAEWQAARDQGQPLGTFPVTEDGELRQEDTETRTIGGLDAFQVNFFGGDSTIATIYVAHGDQITVFSYVENIIENNPIALVQQDIYALMLNSVEFDTQP